MTRGMRNCNPLTIRRVAETQWVGQRAVQTDRKFVQFNTLEWGIRAACCILRTYARRYKAVCVADIVGRWAPSSENNTACYVRNVCLWTGFSGRQRLTEKDWPLHIKAMARQECGIVLEDRILLRGFCLYKLT